MKVYVLIGRTFYEPRPYVLGVYSTRKKLDSALEAFERYGYWDLEWTEEFVDE